VQGRLRNESLSVKIDSECAHCGQKLHLSLDSELKWSVEGGDENLLVFEPDVDWSHFKAVNIIHDY
jgi:hypothetical protein